MRTTFIRASLDVPSHIFNTTNYYLCLSIWQVSHPAPPSEHRPELLSPECMPAVTESKRTEEISPTHMRTLDTDARAASSSRSTATTTGQHLCLRACIAVFVGDVVCERGGCVGVWVCEFRRVRVVLRLRFALVDVSPFLCL